MYFEKTFYDIQKEEYRKNIKIRKVKIVEHFLGSFTIKIKIIDNNRIIKKNTLYAICMIAPNEDELTRRIENELERYIYLRIKNKCADYVVKKYNEELIEKEGK